MIPLLLLIIILFLYCTCSTFQFSAGSVSTLSPPILKILSKNGIQNTQDFYNNDPRRGDGDYIEKRTFEFLKSANPADLGVIEILNSLEDEKIFKKLTKYRPKSILTTTDAMRTSTIPAILGSAYQLQLQIQKHNIESNYCRDVIYDVLNNINYQQIWNSDKQTRLLSDILIVVIDANDTIDNYIANGIIPYDSPIDIDDYSTRLDTNVIVNGLRNDFYNTRTKNLGYLKDGNKQREYAYKRLAESINKATTTLENNNATPQQKDELQMLKKRVGESLKNY